MLSSTITAFTLFAVIFSSGCTGALAADSEGVRVDTAHGGKDATTHEPISAFVENTDPLIYYHGRWDVSPGTWWTGSGFKIAVENLTSLTLHLGHNTTSPQLAIGVSVDWGEFVTVNVSAGANAIPIGGPKEGKKVVRVNAQGWQNNRLHLESIELNPEAKLVPYETQKLAFQFIGDSLSAGQFLPKGVDQAWPFIVAETLKAEHNIQAQPGATLTDMESYGNQHGLSYQFFQTEDTGYYWSSDHNYTTSWDFKKDVPARTHIVVNIATNDASHNVSSGSVTGTYMKFLSDLRRVYPTQPIFVMVPFGWPQPDGSISAVYEGVSQVIVSLYKNSNDDMNVFLVDSSGWMKWDDVFPDNSHPHVEGHARIAKLFLDWLDKWGLKAEESWRA